jgi:hypothetical protein
VTNQGKESSLPEFPTEVIKGLAMDFVNLYKNRREVPDELLWAAFMTYLGNIISPYARLRASETSEPRLYTANLGRSGRTKKSTALNLARDFVKKLFGTDLNDNLRIIEGFGSAEGLAEQLLICDAQKTPAVLHLDEVNILAQKTGMDGSIGISLLNKLFEDHHYEHPLKQGNIRIGNAHLSIVGASTLEDYQKAWSGKHKDTGFFSRLFIVPAEPTAERIAVPVSADATQHANLCAKTLECIEGLKKQRVEFDLEPEAAQLWEGFYSEFGDGDEWNRIDTYAFRLMALQAVVIEEKSITKEIMEDVIKLSRYQTEARLAVSPVIAENQCAVVEQLIRRALPEGTTLAKRALQRKINADRYGIQHFHNALRNLESTGEVSRMQQGKTVIYTRIDEGEDELSSVINTDDDSSAAQRAA